MVIRGERSAMAGASEGPRTSSDQPGGRPVLSEPQLTVLRRYGTEQRVAIGDVLFRNGDLTYDLIVLLEGEVQITEHQAQPDEFLIVTYRPAHCTAGRPAHRCGPRWRAAARPQQSSATR